MLCRTRKLLYNAGVPPRRVLVLAPNWVGDLVMATAAFARIRAGFPDAEITCGLRPYLRTLLDGSRLFDDLVELPKVGTLGVLRQARSLRRRRFDLAIVLPNSLRAGVLVAAAGIRRRLGYRQGRRWLMNLGLRAEPGRRLLGSGPRRVPKPMPDYYDELLDVIGLPPADRRPRLTVSEDERQRCERWFGDRGVGPGARIAVLNAGASYGASKLWEPARFAAVARALRDRHGLVPVFLAGPSEADVVRSIAAAAGALAAVDPTLPVGMLKPMLERAELLITTDSGPRHVAVALGIPVVCLIGPTDPRYTNYCLERTEVLRLDLDCMPCQKKECPLGHHDCMRRIEVDDVLAAAERLLARRAGAGAGQRR